MRAGEFLLSAVFVFPPMLRSRDLAQVRAVFNEAVEKGSVISTLDGDAARFLAGGRTAPGYGLNDVELVQVVVERADCRTFVQNLSVGLNDPPGI